MAAAGLVVVKLGGSHAFSHYLTAWLDALAPAAGRVVIVPGGGPFADAVRAAQRQMGFDDRAAHSMALLAMEQYACALASLRAPLIIAQSAAGIRTNLRACKLPVWAPSRMALRAKDVPWSWDVTSDSLAAWLAGQLGAALLVVVKSVQVTQAQATAAQLVSRGWVDPLFPRFAAAAGCPIRLFGSDEQAGLTRMLAGGAAEGLEVLVTPPHASLDA
jgi:aspartokinase-like uncharacterized kinase